MGIAGALLLVLVAAVVLLRGSGRGPAQTSQSNLPLAPDIDITLYQGQAKTGGARVALSQLWARGPVVVNFWAGLCPPCRAEMPDMQSVYDARGDRVILVGVDIGPFIGLGSPEDGKALLRELRITYPAGTTTDARTVRNYQVLGMPTTVFITPQGRIFRKYTGLLTRRQMETFLDDLLEASAAR
jgi:thiol-disulfide isomerase/thioredoxin